MARKRKSKKSGFVWVLFVLSLVLIVVSLFLSFEKRKPLDVIEYDVRFVVQDGGIGIDLNGTALAFGALGPGNGARRKVIVDNRYNFPVEVNFLVSKNLVGLVRLEGVEQSVIIDSGGNVSIPIELRIPENFSLGNYTGSVRFEMYKAEG